MNFDYAELLSSKQVAKILQVSDRWLRKNRSSDDPIPFIQLGRIIRYEKKVIARWIKQHGVGYAY